MGITQRNRNLRLFDPYASVDNDPFKIDTTGLFDSPFDPSKAALDEQPLLETKTNPLDSPDSNLRALRKRARPYMDQYAELLKSEPQREDHQLSKIGKALAAASGIIASKDQGPAHGIALYNQLENRPFMEAKQDFASKGGNLKELAGIEDAKLSDEEKLEVAIAADEAKRRDDIRAQLLAESTMSLNTARMQELQERGKVLGLSMRENKLTGYYDLVDLKNGSVTPTTHKMSETPQEKEDREFKDWEKKNVIQQKDRLQIVGVNHANDQIMQGIRAHHDIEMQGMRENADARLATLRSNLERLSPSQRNAALEGAYTEVMTMHPQMKDTIFRTGDDGKPVMKERFNPVKADGTPNVNSKGQFNFDPATQYSDDQFKLFAGSVEELMKQRIGDPSSGLPTGSIPRSAIAGDASSPNAASSSTGTTKQSAPVDAALRALAAADLQKNGFPAGESNISKWIDQYQADKAKGSAPPQVTPPVQTPPQVQLTPDNPINAMMSRNAILGRSGKPRVPLNRLAVTDPNQYGAPGAPYTGLPLLTPEEKMRRFGERSGNFVQQLPNIVFGGR
jgi:hypothetical protein